MTITLEEINGLQRDQLRTTTRKIIYLTIRRLSEQTGWAEISIKSLCEQTGLTRAGLVSALKAMQTVGLIEIKRERIDRYSKNKYRTIEL